MSAVVDGATAAAAPTTAPRRAAVDEPVLPARAGDLADGGGGADALALHGGGSTGSEAPRPSPSPTGPVDLRLAATSALVGPASTPGPDPRADLEPGDLRSRPGGWKRTDEGVFVADVAPDGTVRFTDRPNLRWQWKLPTPGSIAHGLASWITDPYTQRRRADCDPTLRSLSTECATKVDAEDDKADHGGVVPVLGATFDVTDAIMRAAGQDPYASRKLDFIDRTEAVRVEMARDHRATTLAATTEQMRRNLRALWRAEPDAERRRRALFEMWDECFEDGTDDEQQAGRDARGQVLAWIRSHAAAGTAAGYADDELRELNARRRSRQVFAPYDTP
ncbi:MAG: hypothetical protein R2939_14655 [Kofleriaceae bacterium]